jgi:hypothetical protein
MMWTLGPFDEYISQPPQKKEKSLLWSCGLQDADQIPMIDDQEQPPLTQSAA